MSGNGRCPVCGRPAGPAATCGECGWLLYLPLRAGPVTASLRHDFGSRLESARRNQAERDGRALSTALANVIGDLYSGPTWTVIDVGADQVALTTAGLDDAGSPHVRESGGVAWTNVLDMLPAAEQARHAQLADGIDGLDDDRIGRLLRDRMPPVSADRVLVICRPAGWRVLEAAATALAARPHAQLLRMSGRIGVSIGQTLADLATKAPLRYPYQLMTVTVDSQTGAVALRPRQLFAAGAGPDTKESLSLRRMPGDMSDTTLAIFADTGGGSGGTADPLALYSVPWPAGITTRLRVILDGPGRVRIAEPTGAVPHPDTWAQVRDRIPRRVSTAAAPVDLVCAIDLAGPLDVVRQRKGLVHDLVQLLGTDYPARQQLRVGVVTCTDHIFGRRRGAEFDRVTRSSELGPADEALAWLDEQGSADISYQPCAPVEDLLDTSLRLLAGSRRRQRIPRLLTVAGRRPHPYPQPYDNRLPCPLKLKWETLMSRLTREAGVRCAAVADTLPGRAERTEWRQLGPAGLRVLSSATARQVAEDLGLLVAHDQRIPLPLIDEHEGAVR
jgi:hypothetical protein